MKQLMLCMLLCGAAPQPVVPVEAQGKFCVLYRFFDKGTVKTAVFASGTLSIGKEDVKIPLDTSIYRIMTFTLEAHQDCLPGEWSILNESVYQLDWFGEVRRKSAATTKPDYFEPYSTAAPQSEKNGTMRVSFLVPFKDKHLETARFSLYIFCNRTNPDCIVCPSPGEPAPLLQLRGYFEKPRTGAPAKITLDPVASGAPVPLWPKDYFPTITDGCDGPLPVLPYPVCR